jgi:hypothetical protein
MNDKFAALLHMKWIAGDKDNHITGYWGEDYSMYTIICPHQLRDLLIEMQNWLADKYQTIEKMDKMVRELRGWWK